MGKKRATIALVAAANLILAALVIFLPNTPALARKGLSDTELEINQALALVRGENPMEGIARLKELESKEPNHPELNYHLGTMSAVTQQYVKAIPRLEIAVKDTRFEEANVYLVESYLAIGNNKAAEAIIAKAKENAFSPDINDRILDLNTNH